MKNNFFTNKALYGALFVLFILIIIMMVYGNKDKSKVCIESKCYLVEVADSSKERANGLMYRRSLSPKAGMLFVFEKSARYPFWMKNTYIPLDIIWIDENHQVVYIKEGAKPTKDGSYITVYPDKDAKYVLELNDGEVRKSGIKIGSEMKFEGNIK